MMEELRKQILLYLEKHSRVDLGELAVLLGTDEVTVANEISAMERAKIICGYHTLIDHSVTQDLTRPQNGSVIIRKYRLYI